MDPAHYVCQESGMNHDSQETCIQVGYGGTFSPTPDKAQHGQKVGNSNDTAHHKPEAIPFDCQGYDSAIDEEDISQAIEGGPVG